MSRSNIAFVLTGSVAAYKACDAISRLVQRGHKVRAVATASALRFVGTATLEGLTGERVLTDLFQEGSALEHITLGRWADLVIVCPASANTLNRFAAGIGDSLAGALFLAHDWTKPFLVAPAMNPAMWGHPATRSSVDKLSAWGVRFISVGQGRTACGEIGEGRLAEPAEIVDAVEAHLARPARRLKVLVTSGGTSEPIDGVRVLANTSSGRTGALIAGHLARRGHDVLHLRANRSARGDGNFREETFLSFADLDAALGRILASEEFDAVVHAAAVSDFSVGEILVGGSPRAAGVRKLDSDSPPVLRLRSNPKLIDGLRSRSRSGATKIVAFKLTQGADAGEAARAVESLFAHSGADWVVHNDLSERAGPDDFPAKVHFPDSRPPLACARRDELAAAIERLLAGEPTQDTAPRSDSLCSSA